MVEVSLDNATQLSVSSTFSEASYYRARYYDPSTGRFVKEDPLGFNSGDSNLYPYVGNNSSNVSDPSGLCHGLICRFLGWDPDAKEQEADQQISDITKPCVDPLRMATQPGQVQLALINHIEEQNLMIDALLLGNDVGKALRAFPELRGLGNTLVMDQLRIKHQLNNRDIDDLLRGALAEAVAQAAGESVVIESL
jgi:RHS repeat-associated protein